MRVLAVSPHLDDAAFSAGATLAALADAGIDQSRSGAVPASSL